MRRGAGWQVTGERGSVLLGGLIFTLIITLLGFALFDLTIRESRLVWGSQADYMAFETAQAGLERTLHLLLLDLCGGSAACKDADPDASWADGGIQGVFAGPDTSAFYTLPLANTTACLRDPCGENTNTYTVQLRNLTESEALTQGDVGLLCTPASPSTTCRYLVWVRVTGQFTQGPVTGTRKVQVLAGGKKGPAFGGGMLGGGSGGGTVVGNALIAGELQIVGCSPVPCSALNMSGSAGVRNNYNAMPASLQRRIPELQLVTCLPGTLCAGSQVESLGVIVRIARADANPPISLTGFATLGTSAPAANPVTGRLGKPSLDKVFIGNGCDLSDCSDEVSGSGGAQNVYTDSPIKPNEVTCPPSCFPELTDKITVEGIEYPNYAACSGPDACTCPTGSGCAANGATSDFFITHAFKIVPGTLEDSGGCPTAPNCTRDLHALLTTTGIVVAPPTTTPSFTKTFACAGLCDDVNGKRVNGAIGAAAPTGIQLQWDETLKLLRVNQCNGVDCTAVFQESVLLDPPQTILPPLFYVDGPLKLCEGCNANAAMYFRGHGTFLAKGDVRIDSSFLAWCPDCPDQGGAGSDHNAFPRKSLLTFVTPGNVRVGLGANRDVMGVFYAGGQWETQRQTNAVGTVTARSFQMGNQVPRFFHVPSLAKTIAKTIFRPAGSEWTVTTSNWRVCRDPACS